MSESNLYKDFTWVSSVVLLMNQANCGGGSWLLPFSALLVIAKLAACMTPSTCNADKNQHLCNCWAGWGGWGLLLASRVADDDQFQKELQYEMNGKMKLPWAENALLWTGMGRLVEIRQSKINSRWVAGPIGQTNRQPSVWCSKYYFFLNFYRLGHSKLFTFIFVFF